MPIYWTLKRVPELSELGFWERGRAWRRAIWASRFYLYWRYWASVAVVAACLGAGGLVGILVGSLVFGNAMFGIALFMVLVSLLAFIPAAVWHGQVLTELVRPHIRARNRAP
jgi:hypothetical protein